MAQPKPQSKAVYRIKRMMKDVALDALFPRLYRQAVVACPNPQKVVFLETKESTMPVAMRHIYERLLAQTGYDVEFVTLRQNNSSVPRYYVHCREAVPVLAQARAIFLCDASDLVSALPIRPETTVVQLWHACGAFKKWGMSTADAKFGESRADQKRHPFYGNLDLVTVSAPEVVWAYEEAMDLQGLGTVQPLGVAATDVYFDPVFLENARAQVEAAVPQAVGKRIVLYAPTFRGLPRHAFAPEAIDFEELRDQLGKSCIVLVKNHPFVKQSPCIPDSCRDFAMEAPDGMPINELLAAVDVCVTDYSSIVFEFALFDRPVFFFAYDLDDYQDWRGFYYDYQDFVPGPIVKDTAALAAAIKESERSFDVSAVREFRQRYMSSCDGCATERIMDFAGLLLDAESVPIRQGELR